MSKGSQTKDLYAELGVSRDAEVDVIKKAYRKLAHQYHPDRNPDDDAAEERFKRVSQAYAVLSDPEQRKNYDEFGDIALDPNFDAEKARSFSGGFGGSGAHFGGDMGGLGSLFEDLFRGGRGGGPFGPIPQSGVDLESEFDLDFLEAARGTERRLTIGRPQADGSTRRDTLTVRVPAGVPDGARIRVAGKGGEGANGGPPGDLYARIHVRPHRFFKRDGQDLQIELPVSFREATLGADVEVPTLDGRVTLHIAPGSDGGSKLRLRGKGLPAYGKRAAGDLYVTLRIRVPKQVDVAERERIEALTMPDAKALRGDLFD